MRSFHPWKKGLLVPLLYGFFFGQAQEFPPPEKENPVDISPILVSLSKDFSSTNPGENYFQFSLDSLYYPSSLLHPGKLAQNQYVLRNHRSGLGRKLGRAEFLIGSAEAAGMITLMMLPKKITKWEHNWVDDARLNFKRAFTKPPVWDKDDFVINWIGHPVAGSYYYNALRSQNATVFQSFLFSVAQSTIWEYCIEGFAEQPSIQDLFSTPIGGLILGEASHLLTLRMRRNGFNFAEKVVVWVLNPMYALNNGFKTPPVYQPRYPANLLR